MQKISVMPLSLVNKMKHTNPCVFCGKKAGTVDHLVPKIKGGKNTPDNLVPACAPCNQTKGSLDLAAFLLHFDSAKQKQQAAQNVQDAVSKNLQLMAKHGFIFVAI